MNHFERLRTVGFSLAINLMLANIFLALLKRVELQDIAINLVAPPDAKVASPLNGLAYGLTGMLGLGLYGILLFWETLTRFGTNESTHASDSDPECVPSSPHFLP